MNKLKGLTLNQAYLLKDGLIKLDIEGEDENDSDFLLDQLNDIIIYLEGKN